LQGENLFKHSFSAKNILVVGSESHGISSETEKLMDASIHIPGSGKAESLNAGVAGAIMMSTWFGNQSR
jgi:TrmH family RNA methyltransferase